jgi:hypothetical protein
VTLQAVADTFVDEGSPSATGGSSQLLYVDLGPDQRAYLAFDVPGGTVISARLRLYVHNPSTNGPTIHPATNAWAESSLTWSNQPPLSSTALVDLGAVSTGWLEVDVTGAMKAGARNSLVLVPTSTDGLDLRSRESSDPPQLILEISDISQPSPDSGHPTTPDASVPQPDTAEPTSDAEAPQPDSSVPTPDAAVPQPDAAPVAKANTFACLDSASSVQVVSGFHHDEFSPSISKDKAFDARTAEFLIEDTKYGMIDLIGGSSDTGVCWAGGYVYTELPWDASWYDHYADSSYPSKYGTWDDSMKNHVGIDARLYSGTVTGLHVYNMHDGYRFNSAEVSFVLQHSWAEYIRDDCIENVGRESGLIYDNYFDGCYSGISVRTNSSSVYSGRVVQMKKNLIYMEPQPWPYKYDEKSFYFTHQGITYGSGNLFKMDPDAEQNPQFVLEDNVFLFTQESASSSTDLPDEQFLNACSNNTIIWLGSGAFPGSLPSTSKFPNCYTILTGAAGQAFWKAKVQDWFARHPDVDPARHPPVSQQGEISFPRVF